MPLNTPSRFFPPIKREWKRENCEEPFICHRVSFATLNHVIIKFRPARMPLPLFARREGHNARVRFYRLQFGNDSNAVADNRGDVEGHGWGLGGSRGRSVENQNNPLESQLQWSQSRSPGINLLLVTTRLLSHSHSKLARLVVGPFWAWIWTGGGPSVH